MKNWTPTPENINALPPDIKRYIHSLETLCDPAGLVQENALLKETVEALLKKVWTMKPQPKICRTCEHWTKPSCGYGLGNCAHIDGRGMPLRGNTCDNWEPSVLDIVWPENEIISEWNGADNE